MNRVLPLLLFVFPLVFFFCGCATEQPVSPNRLELPVVVEESKPEEPLPVVEIKAPWEIEEVSDPELTRLLSEKKVKEALTLLAEKKKASPNVIVFTQQASLFLKLGRPEEALNIVSEFVNLNQLQMEDLPPSLSLIAAYAYKKQKDIDQTFAWFGVCLRKVDSPLSSRVAKREVQNLLARISDKIFASYFIKWERDQSLSPLILEEQIRRREGGAVVRLEEIDYFSPATYGYLNSEIPKVAPLLSDQKTAEIVILSPVKSSRVIEDQKKAIEIALNVSTPPLGFKSITSQEELLSVAPKVILNLGPKNLALSERSNEAVIITLNPRLSESQSSIAPSLIEEMQELVKVIQNDAQCEQTYAVVEDSIDVPSSFKRISVDELLELASTQNSISLPCLIGSFEVENQIEKLTRIKARLPGLRLFGRSSWVDPVLLQTYQGLFEGSVFITPYYAGSSRELVREFLSSFQNSVGTQGTYSSALAYDAGRISSLIIGNKQPEGASYNLQSVTGIESFVVNRDKANGTKRVSIAQRRFTRLTLKNGELEELSSY